ncbi:penicillin acylase family protein [Rhabdaerophilum sp. SD176]|uniref:penicillin acylase family protein n=1 Tax=Rhabdaerophilum sp. SD176 TaxID=2983548 RepID=UPI0024DF9916|nr:penicillin acylase family protein [Rhabdaerophilum sp. SD176]
MTSPNAHATPPSPLEHNLTFSLPGLAAPGRIRVDRWGIPHLEAARLDDLWFVQGFNAARDRLFQIDLWRKRGLGLLAADFGPGFLEQDRAARLFLYRGDLTAEWAAYAPDAEAICSRFAHGINAYIALAERDPTLMPPEFSMLGTQPARWQAADVVRIRSHGLTRNALWEVQRLQVLAGADAETDLLRKYLYPAVDTPLPEGVRAEDCPIEALLPFRLAQANVTFSPERLAAGLTDAPHWRQVNDLNEVLFDAEASGSNNWVIAGARSPTGLPILASDPHRAHSLPSLRYIQHLRAPGFDAIGGGEPCVPGLSIGHNGDAAFGLTIFGADQEDVYLLETDPARPEHYRFEGGWRAMTVLEEAIPVKGHPDQPCRLVFSHHGPILWRNAGGTRAVALRSVWFEPGSAPYLQSLTMLRTRTPEAFRASAERWGSPSVNLVYADRQGEIAWSPGGFMPARRNWKGLTPVPGTGSHEWDGFLDAGQLPFLRNPEAGFVATANEMNLPADWPHEAMPVGFEWTEASRATRIHEVLAGDHPVGVAESQALQTDAFSVPARRLCGLLGALDPVPAGIAPALALLAGWDHVLSAGSGPAALFELWYTSHLRHAVMAKLAPEAVRKLLLPGDVEGICRALEAPDSRWGTSPEAARDAMLCETLAAAWADANERLGPDPARWAWGKLHHGQFDHPLSSLLQRNPERSLDIGPLPKGGSASSPMHAGYRPSDFRVTHGASFRMVVDLADLDRSVTINAPGQSGDPRSAHYADLAPLWAEGAYVPMLYSDAAIAEATHFTWTLLPV